MFSFYDSTATKSHEADGAPFAGDLHQPKPRHIHQDRFDRVTGKLFPERPHQRLLIFFRFHIDKIHNNNTGKIPQGKLARHLMRRLQVDL